VADSDTAPPTKSTAVASRFTRLYVLTFSGLALFIGIGLAVVQWRMCALQNKISTIRYASVQRYQSQQVVKFAMQLMQPADLVALARTRARLRTKLAELAHYHRQGRSGQVIEYNAQISHSDTIRQLYRAIEPDFMALQTGGQALLATQKPISPADTAAIAGLNRLLAHEDPFLEQMEGIVQQHTVELRHELAQLQWAGVVLYLLSVVVLAGIGLFIFRPAVRKLSQTLRLLVEEQWRTATVNQKLLVSNNSLKQTRQQLIEATSRQHQQEILAQKQRTAYLLAGQEDERKRLAQDLHDGLGQMLMAIKMQVEGLDKSLNRPPDDLLPPGRTRDLTPLKNLIVQTIQETRSISNNLMPSVLSDFGIVAALKLLAEQQTTTINNTADAPDVTVETNLNSARFTGELPDKNIEIMLYRVSQEAVNNALQHGRPRHIRLQLVRRADYLHLIVTDDGRGFVPAAVTMPDGDSPAHGQGIRNMQERVKLLNGRFSLTSVPNKGTRIQVSVPYHAGYQRHEHAHSLTAGR
jgi:signal transduction histidine kinase